MKALLARVDMPARASILEIGCGNAIGSAFLADKAKTVVATDLPQSDRSTHSIGMAAPQRLLGGLGIRNCHLTAASASHLPFSDGCFDVVFALYVLEHVPVKPLAVAEIQRVLRPGGTLIAFVPNFVERLYAPFFFYVYLASRLIAKTHRPKQMASSGDGARAHEAPSTRRTFRQTYPFFPLPNPHGAYTNSLEELHEHLPSQWAGELTRGGFDVSDRFFLMNLPANAASLVFGERGMRLYDRLSKVDAALGSSPAGPALGQYACFVATRRP